MFLSKIDLTENVVRSKTNLYTIEKYNILSVQYLYLYFGPKAERFIYFVLAVGYFYDRFIENSYRRVARDRHTFRDREKEEKKKENRGTDTANRIYIRQRASFVLSTSVTNAIAA